MSLKDLCMTNISNSIMNAPPEIQEMIIDTTKKNIEKKIKDDIIYETTQLISFLTRVIVHDMIECLERRRSNNYYVMYNHINKHIVSTAIDSAKLLFEKIETLNTNRRFINIIDAYDPESDVEYDESNRYEDEDDDRSFISV